MKIKFFDLEPNCSRFKFVKSKTDSFQTKLDATKFVFSSRYFMFKTLTFDFKLAH